MLKPIDTEKGHLDKEKRILQSTQEYPINNKESLEDVFTDQEQKKHIKEQGHADLTRSLPLKSYQGNQYMLVVYNFDSKNIFVETLKNRQVRIIKTTWYIIYDTLSNSGFMLKLYLLDNEASLDLKALMT